MIYSAGFKPYEFALFACDIDSRFYEHFRPDWLAPRGAEAWLRHNRNRIYLRAYVFCDSVLERHKNGQMGFQDPVIIWADKEKGEFTIHPGQNRIILKMLLPEVRMVGWVRDDNCRSRKEYSGIFNNIQPLVRDKNGNRLVTWQTLHRSNVGGEDQYHEALTSDTYLGNRIHDTDERKEKWAQLQKTQGFSCRVNGTHFYNIGKPTAEYDFENIAGIYQAFLHHFHNFSYSKWDKLHFRRI